MQAVHRILALRDAIQTKGFDHHFLISSGHAIYRSDCVSGVDEELMEEARRLCPPVNYGAPLLCDGRFLINNTCRLLCPSSVLRPGHGNFEKTPTVYNGPYEYSVPGMEKDFLRQDEKAPEGARLEVH